MYDADVCVTVSNTKYFCTTQNEQFYSVNSVSSDRWAYGQQGASGIFGLGSSSPIWAILGNPSTKKYDIYMTNFNSWTWADPSYQKFTANSIMNLGTFSADYTTSMAHTTIAPKSSGSYLFSLTEFGFGYTDDLTKTQYYESILNWDPLNPSDFFNNATSLALDFRGLGLPAKQFEHFNYLLTLLTKGEATCLNKKSGYCLLANACSHYNQYGLWNYDFKVAFNTQGDTNYLRVPLATFAANSNIDGGVCAIFVEFLDSTEHNDGKFIIFGGMFFQSFYTTVQQVGVSGVEVNIYKNLNALP